MQTSRHPMTEPTRWTIHGERVIDESRRLALSIADVELPDGTRFEQYVLRMQRAAMVVLLNDDKVLMMWRHRFIIDRWVWELPGGYVEDDEDPTETAQREIEEETGWRPGPLELLLKIQPIVGSGDAENLIYLARSADHVGGRDINEAERIEWIPLDSIPARIEAGEIVGSSSVAGLLKVLLLRSTSGR